MIKIDIWSDFACPFCYIGKRRLEKALEQFAAKEEVKVNFKSFELQPDAPKDHDKSMLEILADKYNMSIAEAKNMTDGVAKQAAGEGLTFRFDTMISTNTLAAHRLMKFAEMKNKAEELTEAIFYAYFTESKHIGDIETLVELAKTVQLDENEVRAVLENDRKYELDVRTDQMRAQQLGVRGVPFFVLNDKFAVSGAQTTDTFVIALNKAWEDAKSSAPLQDLSKETDATCTDDGCNI